MNFQKINQRYGLQVVVLLILLVILLATTPAFRSTSGVFATLEGLTLLGIVGTGVAVTMIARELDLSVGAMAALAGVISIRIGDLGLLPAVVIATSVGVIFGALQGYFIARLRINSMVFTVGTLILLGGVAWLVTNGNPISLNNYGASDILLMRIGVFTTASIIAIISMVLIGVFLQQTKYGREIYAIGGARQEAIAAGVPLRRSLVISFAISGGCASLAGALASLKSASAAPDNFGELLLTVIGACLIGGISLLGGRGTVVNVLLGVLIIQMVTVGLVANAAPAYIVQLATGVLLLVVISAEFIVRGRRPRQKIASAVS